MIRHLKIKLHQHMNPPKKMNENLLTPPIQGDPARFGSPRSFEVNTFRFPTHSPLSYQTNLLFPLFLFLLPTPAWVLIAQPSLATLPFPLPWWVRY